MVEVGSPVPVGWRDSMRRLFEHTTRSISPPKERWKCWVTFVLSKLTRSKFIVWTDEWGWPKPFLRRVLSPLTDLVFHHAEPIVVHGTKHKKHFRSSPGIGKNKLLVSGNASSVPVGPNLQTNVERLARTRHLSGRLVVLYVGGLVKRKGADLLVRAFERLYAKSRAIHLMIVGDGSERSHLVNLSLKLGLESNVSFERWVDHDDIAPSYALADVVVLPSTLRGDNRNPLEPLGEPWGLVVN